MFKNTEGPVTLHVWTTHTLWQKFSTVVISVGGVSNSKIGKGTETNGVACTQLASFAGDGNKISSSLTADPLEAKVKTPSMSVGNPQHSHDQNGNRSSNSFKSPENLEFFEMLDLCTVDFPFFCVTILPQLTCLYSWHRNVF